MLLLCCHYKKTYNWTRKIIRKLYNKFLLWKILINCEDLQFYNYKLNNYLILARNCLALFHGHRTQDWHRVLQTYYFISQAKLGGLVSNNNYTWVFVQNLFSLYLNTLLSIFYTISMTLWFTRSYDFKTFRLYLYTIYYEIHERGGVLIHILKPIIVFSKIFFNRKLFNYFLLL